MDEDLKRIGPAAARRVVQAIDKKLATEPEKFGASLSHNLKDFRKLRIGDLRVVYQVVENKVIVFVLAVGPRRDKEIYQSASYRILNS